LVATRTYSIFDGTRNLLDAYDEHEAASRS